MCCVVGYIGESQSRALIVDGLSRLEYRGYDSAGIACLTSDGSKILSVKSVGGVDQLAQRCVASEVNGVVGVGHTRWSTHGAVNLENAHPVFDCKSEIAIVHNGIIENLSELREQLMRKGHVFRSETDSEVIAHLIEQEYADVQDLQRAVLIAVNRLEGAYAFVALVKGYPETLIAVRKRSPLCLGIADDGIFVASDQIAFAGKAKEVVFMPDGSYAFVHRKSFEIFDFNGQQLCLEPEPLSIVWNEGGKDGFEHFMLKEIYEQHRVICDTIKATRNSSHLLDVQLGVSDEFLRDLRQVMFIGCGTSWHAAHIAAIIFESVCKIPAVVGLASEFKHREFFIPERTLCIAVSQSGETADTLELVRLLNERSVPTVALTNVASSTMVREAGGFLLTHAGQEVAVASTKSFTAQIASLFLLAYEIARRKGLVSASDAVMAQEDLLVAAEILERTIETYKVVIATEVAPLCMQQKHAIFIGRHMGYVLAQEAALKLKEIAYIFSEAFPAGELKHGPLALIEQNTLVVMFSVLDPAVYKKLISNAQEVRSRGAYLIVFAFAGQEELIKLGHRVFIFPKVQPLLAPLAMVGVMQFLIYKIAHQLQRPIDKPRNLAKSVTVE